MRQHLTFLRFFPSRPADSTFAMYSHAEGTLHDVSPMSMVTIPIFFAAAFAFALRALT